MKKIVVLALIGAAVAPVAASAQNAELRNDRQDIRQEQRDVNRAIRDGASPREVQAERRDVRDARREYREDWRDYRRTHGDVFRGPAYVGPRGYVYRPVVIGHRFDRIYYDRRYYVDAGRYRLPPAVGPQRWVRYGNDVVLVNVRTGRVIQVYNRFFF